MLSTMDNPYWYPVYFECPELLPGHERRVERYFGIHRKSGGGDCGPLRKVSDGVYSVSFRHQKDQRAVLQRSHHVVDVVDTLLEFTVREGPAPSSPQTNTTPGGAVGFIRDNTENLFNTGPSLPPSGGEHELQLHTQSAVWSLTEGGAAAGRSGDSVRVVIIQGTIETQKVDAVVSPMIGADPRSTHVGNSLFETEGHQLTDIFRRQGEGETPGDSVLVEGLTGAPFSAVFFVHLIPWDNDPNGTAVQVLRMVVSNVLTSCENQGFSSLALPVLGARTIFGFPEDVVALVLNEEIHSFHQRRTSRSPFMVHIVCHPDEKTFREIFSFIQESLPQPVDKESDTRRIVLLGKTGSGKSSLGNTIFGQKVFRTDDTPNSGTNKCQAETRTVNGRNITLIDTPGFFDTGRPEEELKPEILNCLTECTPGPHAFLIMLRVDKFSEQEEAFINKICNYFTEEAFKYAIVVFTHGNQLPAGTNIQTFIQQNERLCELVRKCGNRCHVFDNKYWKDNQRDQYRSNQFQVEQLLKSIDKMVMETNWRFYTNEAFKAVETEIEKEEKEIKQTTPNKCAEEIREEAKRRVSDRILISLAGIGTGVLLGAIFGVEAFVRTIFKAVQCPGLVAGVQTAATAAGLAVTGEAVLIVGGVAVGVAAGAGGVAGGVIGGQAADGAESVWDAYERAKKAVLDKRKSVIRHLNNDPR